MCVEYLQNYGLQRKLIITSTPVNEKWTFSQNPCINYVMLPQSMI
jgi:hypothetical protein